MHGGGAAWKVPSHGGAFLHPGMEALVREKHQRLEEGMSCPDGWHQGTEVQPVQLETVRSSVSNKANTEETYFPDDVALGWFMPLRFMPWLYFISVVTTAPSRYETTLPVPAVSLGRVYL